MQLKQVTTAQLEYISGDSFDIHEPEIPETPEIEKVVAASVSDSKAEPKSPDPEPLEPETLNTETAEPEVSEPETTKEAVISPVEKKATYNRIFLTQRLRFRMRLPLKISSRKRRVLH